MNPSPFRIVLLVSISLATGCTAVEDGGLNSAVPSSQPAGSEVPIDAGTAFPSTTPDVKGEPDAARPADAVTSADAGPPDDAGTSDGAGPEPPADAAIAPAPDLAPSPPDAAPPPPDSAPPPVDVDDPAGTCPQTPDLTLCLRFEGTVRDDSRYQLAAASSNVSFQAGPTGQAIDLNAQSSVVVPPNPIFDSASVTLEAWVQPRALGRRMGVITNGNQYGLVILPSGSAMCTGGGGYALTGDAVRPDQWTSLTCTYDAALVTLWIDGKKTAENPRMGPVRTGSQTGVNVGNEVPEGNVFEGLIDNVRVWRQVRSARQISAGAR
jgi:hypothetical protein